MKLFRHGLAISVLGGFISLFAVSAYAVDPFDNWANSPGWYAVDYPAYYKANVFTDKDGKKKFDPKMQVVSNVFRAIYYTKSVLPNTLMLSALIPYDKMEMTIPTGPGASSKQKASGLGDLTLVSGYMFTETDSPKSTFGVGLFVDLPTGAYDKTKMVNAGADVWSVRPMLAYSRLFGPLDIESTLKYNMPSENSGSAMYGGAKVREGNKLIFSSYAGCFMSEKGTAMVGAHFNYQTADASKIRGKTTPGIGARAYQIGGSFTYLPSPEFNVMLQVMNDFSTRNSTEGTLYMGRLAWYFKGS